MTLKLKICGMRDQKNILKVGALNPDFMGFIFYDQSPRCVPRTFRIPSELNPSISKVGVFVDDAFGRVFDMVNKYALDFAQLHGDETAAFCEKLKQADMGVIKAFSIDENFDFKLLHDYKPVVDFFLFDAKGKYRGGNAVAFDWNLLLQYDQEIPFFLSGGISSANINRAVQLNLNVYGVDVNSGVESSPGIKDVEQVMKIQENLKSKI